jgi:amidase
MKPAMYDATALDVPWRDLEVPPSAPKLRLGLLSEDPTFPLHPSVKRALAQAVSLLEAKGHEVVRIPPSRAQVANALALAFAYFGLDDPPAHIAASGEPLVPSVVQAMEAFGAFKCDFLDDCEGLTGIPRLAALNVKRESIANGWRRIWREERLDAVIGPPAQSTAVAHDTFGLPPYTLLLNVLDVGRSQTSKTAKRELLLTPCDSIPHASCLLAMLRAL